MPNDPSDKRPAAKSFDERLAALTSERDSFGRSDEEQAKQIIKQNAISAAMAICEMATSAANERVRLAAATYIVDRNLGRVQDSATPSDPLDIFLSRVMEDAKTSNKE